MIPDWAGYLKWREGFWEAVDQRLYTKDWIDMEFLAGRLAMLTEDDGAILFSFRTYPTGWVELVSFAATGALETIKGKLIPLAEAAAKSLGAKSAKIESREAWERLMPDYRRYKVVIEKEL